MARIKIKHSVLEAMGFRRRDLGEGMYDLVMDIHKGWQLQYWNGHLELVHGGTAVPIPCRGEEHLRTLIQAF